MKRREFLGTAALYRVASTVPSAWAQEQSKWNTGESRHEPDSAHRQASGLAGRGFAERSTACSAEFLDFASRETGAPAPASPFVAALRLCKIPRQVLKLPEQL